MGLHLLEGHLLLMVFQYLDLKDLSKLRLVNLHCTDIATDLCFRTITFSIRQTSMRNLAHVASSKYLAERVKTLVLQRRKSMRKYDTIEEWEEAVNLPDSPSHDQNDTYDDIMSHNEWLQCTETQKDSLYRQYNIDREKENDNAKSLSETLRFRRVGYRYSEKVQSAVGSSLTETDRDIAGLDEILSKFKSLTAFQHNPTALSRNRWVTHWRRLRFNTFDYMCPTHQKDCEDDDDMESLQLSYSLSALGWAKPHLIELNSMVFYVDGPAFWGTSCLRRLWRGVGHSAVRKQRLILGNALKAEKEVNSISEHHIRDQEYAGQLDIMEGTLEGLTHLDCSISEDRFFGGLMMAARSVFRFLQRGRSLERVRLKFGELDLGYPLHRALAQRPTNWDGSKELLTLMTDCKPWPKLRELKLEIESEEPTMLRFLESFSPTLHDLTLSNITLVSSQGTWDTALPAIATNLTNLQSLRLEKLYDLTQDGRDRSLFDREEDVWVGKNDCYDEYEEHTIGNLLQTKKLPELSPKLFIEEHKQRCKHV